MMEANPRANPDFQDVRVRVGNDVHMRVRVKLNHGEIEQKRPLYTIFKPYSERGLIARTV